MAAVLAHRAPALVVQRLGRVEYLTTLEAMRRFTRLRDAQTPDELWLLEHPPIYTLGHAADPAHGPKAGSLPVIRVERGGQVTYHGPGQVVLYTLVDLGRRAIKVREFVCLMEQAVIDLLAGYGVAGLRRPGAPGVYVGDAKVAALGIRVARGCAFHGLALNVDMDLSPFEAIDPCGYPGLRVTQTRDLGIPLAPDQAGERLAAILADAIAHA
ncbi:MAG: lipoyl(octanoyl) transferase LipB [Betaproteobacteria bacterium]|jgi:lipoyl(octanoyl) transferase|nr:lipoyl(octanoyl) transferase LipB [Betaproteobacteria bacterium]